MAELARGTVADRPWGRTLGALGLHGLTGQLTLAADGKRYQIAFVGGAVVGAVSPLATDAAVRVALTGGLLSSTQVADIARRQAAAPDRDEIDLISELLRIAPDQSMRLRRRAIAQRAARTFAVDRGEFVVDDQITLSVVPGSELDVRSIIYLGARQNLSETRLAGDLDQIGGWFRLQPSALEDLPQFAFTEAERPVLERLTDGATLEELETAGVEARIARAMVYALVSCNACEIGGPGRAYEAASRRAARPPPATVDPVRPRRPTGMTPPVGAAISRPRTPSQAPPVSANPSVATGRLRPPGSVVTGRLRPVTAQVGAQVGTKTAPPVIEGTGSRPQITIPPGAGSRPQITIPSGTGSRPQIAIPPEPGSRPQIPLVPPGAGGPITGRPRSASIAPPLPTGGPTTGRVSPPLPTGGPTTGRVSLPQPTGGPTTGRVSLPQPAGGPTTGRVSLPHPASTPPSRRGVSIPRVPRRHANSPVAYEVRALIAQRLKLLEQGVDHFQLLGIAQDTPSDDIRKAYFALARQLHPDRLAALDIDDDSREAQRLFAHVNTAFAILSDRRRRDEYAAVLRRGGEAVVRAEQAQAEAMAMRIIESEDAFQRGEAALRRDQLPLAITELLRAVELHPGEADYHAALAWAQFCAAHDKQLVGPQTRATLERAIETSPKAISPRYYLGRVERMLGHDADALRHFHEVLRRSPGHQEAASEVRVLEQRLARRK